MNPATFLRALGPEPWNVAYVEPLEGLQMADMEKTPIAYNIIINTK